MTTTTSFEMHDNVLHRIGEESFDYIMKNQDKYIEIYEFDYDIQLNVVEVINYAANILLAQGEITKAEYEDVCADLGWIAEQPIVRDHLLDAVNEMISECEYDMEGFCVVEHTPEDFLP